MIFRLCVAFVFAFGFCRTVALRYDDTEWSRISPDVYPESYRGALEAFRLIVLPRVNAERVQCSPKVAVTFEGLLEKLLFVESSVGSYRLTFNSAFEVERNGLVVTFHKSGEQWNATPRACELGPIGLDVGVLLLEDDVLVQIGLRTLIEITEAQCSPDDMFVPMGVLKAVMVEGTRNEQLEMQVVGPAGPHRVRFEFAGAKANLVSSDVSVCDLGKSPPQDSSIMQVWEGLSLPETGVKRQLRYSDDRIAKRAPKFSIPRGSTARLPTYTGPLEGEFHWAEAAPACFGYGPEVQDQGSCEVCYALAALGALSDRHCLAFGREAMSLPDGELRRFSVQDLLSCHPRSEASDGCKGGTVEHIMRTLMDNNISFQDQFPYYSKCYLEDPEPVVWNDSKDPHCSLYSHLPDHPANNKPCSCWASSARPRKQPACDQTVRRQKVQYAWGTVCAFGDLSLPKRVELIMRYIREGGPVVASFIQWDDFRPFVFFNPHVPYRRGDVSAKFRGGHAVVITGWGTSKEGIPYWWARNSWGVYWGTKGYFKIARGSSAVGIENHVIFSLVKEDSSLDPGKPSFSAFGIRLPWSNDLVLHRGRLVREEVSTRYSYAFVPSGVDGGPIVGIFHTQKIRIEKDVYTFQGSGRDFVPGRFFLLAVEIPFECSEPCMIVPSGTYDVFGPGSMRSTVLRHVESELDDDSWCRGKLTVYICKDDPLQGSSQSEIKITVVSQLRHQILLQMKHEGVDIDRLQDWHLIPEAASEHTITLPTIPLHLAPLRLEGPVVPLRVSLDLEPVTSPVHNYLRATVYASEFSVYYLEVLDKEADYVWLSSGLKQPPDRYGLLYIGGNHSIGGPSYQSFFDQQGSGFGRLLSIRVFAFCHRYAHPVSASAKEDFHWTN